CDVACLDRRGEAREPDSGAGGHDVLLGGTRVDGLVDNGCSRRPCVSTASARMANASRQCDMPYTKAGVEPGDRGQPCSWGRIRDHGRWTPKSAKASSRYTSREPCPVWCTDTRTGHPAARAWAATCSALAPTMSPSP